MTISAENDGQVIIEAANEPAIHVANRNYLTIEGIAARTSGDTNTVVVGGHDGPDWSDRTTGITLRRVSALGSSPHINSAAFQVARAKQVLLEDVWSFGFARNTMLVYGSENVTVRRAVIRWDGWWGDAYKPNDPRVGLSVYNTRNSLFENVIVLDGGKQGADTHGERVALAISGNHNGETAPFDDSSNNRFYGVILLNNVGAGVNAESGGDTLSDNTFENLISWDNSGLGFNVNRNSNGTTLLHGTIGHNRHGVRFNNYNNVVNNTLKSTLVMGNRKAEDEGEQSFGMIDGANNTDNDYNNVFDHLHDYRKYAMAPGPNSLSAPLALDHLLTIPMGTANQGAAHDGGVIGATVVTRMIDGHASSQALWPYPNEDRIKSEMCESATLELLDRSGDNSAAWCESGQSLSEYIWEYLGYACPGSYCTSP